METSKYLIRLFHEARIIEARDAFQKSFEVLATVQRTEQPCYNPGIEQQRVSFDEFFRNLIYGVQSQPVKAEEGIDFKSATEERFDATQEGFAANR
jgi:hypothetical protein